MADDRSRAVSNFEQFVGPAFPLRVWGGLVLSVMASACHDETRACAVLQDLVVDAGAPGCPARSEEVQILNGCPVRLRLVDAQINPPELGSVVRLEADIAPDSGTTLAISINSQDGGPTEGSLALQFDDGTSASSSIQVSRPVRQQIRLDLEAEPAVDLVVVLGADFPRSLARPLFNQFLRDVGQWSFYRLHFIQQVGDTSRPLSDHSGRSFVQSSDEDIEARFDALFSRVVPVSNVWEGLPSAIGELELQRGSSLEFVFFGTGAESSRLGPVDFLARAVPSGHQLTGFWLFASGPTCPTALSVTYSEFSAQVPAARVLDLCSDNFDFVLATTIRTDVGPRLDWYLNDAFLPSVALLLDNVETDRWTLQRTPNGPLLLIPQENVAGHRTISIVYDRLSSCE